MEKRAKHAAKGAQRICAVIRSDSAEPGGRQRTVDLESRPLAVEKGGELRYVDL